MTLLYNLFAGEMLWKIASYAKKQAILVALILLLVQIAAAMWLALGLLISSAIALMPAHPLSTFAIQFLPSRWAVDTGLTFYFTSLITHKMWWAWHGKIKQAIYLGGHITTKF